MGQKVQEVARNQSSPLITQGVLVVIAITRLYLQIAE